MSGKDPQQSQQPSCTPSPDGVEQTSPDQPFDTNASPSEGSARPGLTDAMRSLVVALARGEESLGDTLQTIDSSVYLDPDRFDQERRHVFHALPVPLLPSSGLACGQALTHDRYGLPLLVTRDRQGTAHVMLNVCRHRGTRLVEDSDVVTASALVCPYHAWTYRLDGTLKGLPRPETFPGLDKANYGLQRYAAVESGGLLWTRLDGSAIDERKILGGVADDFDALGLAQSHLFSRRTHHVKANWKLIMDAFLESYHVQRLHKSTIAPFFADARALSDREGLHFRSVVARKDYALAQADEAFDQLRQKITFSYSLLPATVVVVSPDYINVMLIYPEAVDRTCVEDFMLVPEEPVTEEQCEHWEESFALLDGGVFGAEDFRAAELGQAGLASGGMATLTLGTAEQVVAEFHQTLNQLLDV